MVVGGDGGDGSGRGGGEGGGDETRFSLKTSPWLPGAKNPALAAAMMLTLPTQARISASMRYVVEWQLR